MLLAQTSRVFKTIPFFCHQNIYTHIYIEELPAYQQLYGCFCRWLMLLAIAVHALEQVTGWDEQTAGARNNRWDVEAFLLLSDISFYCTLCTHDTSMKWKDLLFDTCCSSCSSSFPALLFLLVNFLPQSLCLNYNWARSWKEEEETMLSYLLGALKIATVCLCKNAFLSLSLRLIIATFSGGNKMKVRV